MGEADELLAAAAACDARGEPYALATVVAVRGSSYRRPGARLLVARDAAPVGVISGGCLEAEAAALATRALTDDRPRIATIDHSAEGDEVWGSGLGCRGAIDLLLEPPALARETIDAVRRAYEQRRPSLLLTPLDGSPRRQEANGRSTGTKPRVERGAVVDPVLPPLQLVIFGAGPDAPSMVSAARRLGWQVVVIDWRRALLAPERFPGATVQHAQPSDAAASVRVDPRTAVVLMSHHYLRDAEALRGFAEADVAYIGVLGPRDRTDRLLKELGAAGGKLAADPRFHAPAGLDIGADGPDEVAASIVAEIVSVIHARGGGPLRDRPGPIHAQEPT